MPPRKRKQSVEEVLLHIGGQLKLKSATPDIFGYLPHAKQIPFHSSQARGRLYIGGNRSGKTTGGVCEDINTLTHRLNYRTNIEGPVRGRVVCVDYTQGVLQIIIPAFARWLPPSDLINGSWEDSYSKGEKTLTLANGSTCEFMSYEQEVEKFAGTSRHFIHFDEEPPSAIFTECRARLVDTAGSWWMTMTPVEGMTWIYDQIYLPGKENPEAGISVIEVDMHENPYLLDIEIASFESSLSADEKKSRIQGKFVQMGGLVFKAFKPETHVVDFALPWGKNPELWEHYVSIDHGFNNPTAILWHAVNRDGFVLTYDEHYESERTVDYHCKVIKQKNAEHGFEPQTYVGDPAMAQRQGVTGISIQGEYERHGIGVAFANNDVMAGINKINQYLAIRSNQLPSWQVTRNCTNLVREMTRLHWKTYSSKKTADANNKSDLIHKKDDHAPDSARYFFSLMPDLAPHPSAPGEQRLMLPNAPVGVDTFIPHLVRVNEFRDAATTTDWNDQFVDDQMGSEW